MPVEQADNLPVGVRRPRNDDIIRLKVWMADAEMAEGGVRGDKGRRDEEIAVQVLDVVRRRLILVLVAFPPLAPERQEQLTELLQNS